MLDSLVGHAHAARRRACRPLPARTAQALRRPTARHLRPDRRTHPPVRHPPVGGRYQRPAGAQGAQAARLAETHRGPGRSGRADHPHRRLHQLRHVDGGRLRDVSKRRGCASRAASRSCASAGTAATPRCRSAAITSRPSTTSGTTSCTTWRTSTGRSLNPSKCVPRLSSGATRRAPEGLHPAAARAARRVREYLDFGPAARAPPQRLDADYDSAGRRLGQPALARRHPPSARARRFLAFPRRGAWHGGRGRSVGVAADRGATARRTRGLRSCSTAAHRRHVLHRA